MQTFKFIENSRRYVINFEIDIWNSSFPPADSILGVFRQSLGSIPKIHEKICSNYESNFSPYIRIHDISLEFMDWRHKLRIS